MRLLWLSDIHLNFLGGEQLTAFYNELVAAQPDLLVISGDIGEAPTVAGYLQTLSQAVERPIFFVLGNHDYYHGSVAGLRTQLASFTDNSKLVYLSSVNEIPLTKTTAIIGHDGWADGRFGNYAVSPVLMNDHLLIEEFYPSAIDGDRLSVKSKEYRLSVMQRLAGEAAAHFERVLPSALEKFEHVIVVTHVPPFKEACWFKGMMTNDDFLPHFASQVVGDMLKRIMENYPNRQLTVLYGHTHSSGEKAITPNIKAYGARAEYGAPQIQQIFDIE